MAEMGNLTVQYCAPSFEIVNCENPRRKPVSHPRSPNWARGGGFPDPLATFSKALHR